MLVVSEAEAAAIRAVYEQRGELSAAVELRRRFPGITDNAQALGCARTIAGWEPSERPVADRRPQGPLIAHAPTIGEAGRQANGERHPSGFQRRVYHWPATSMTDTVRKTAWQRADLAKMWGSMWGTTHRRHPSIGIFNSLRETHGVPCGR
jgi:hypothetical protein